MAFSMEAARLSSQGTVCDMCGATSSAVRGGACRTCAAGTLRRRSELQALREQRSVVRREARAQRTRL